MNLERFMSRFGEDFEIIREGKTVYQGPGLRNTGKATGRNYVGFYPGTDVKPGDWLKSVASGDEFHVLDVESRVVKKAVFEVKAYYETKVENRQRIESAGTQSPAFHIGAAFGSIIGTQQDASLTFTLDFTQLQGEIEKRGGEDVEELKEMVAEIQQSLQQEQVVRRGWLARFSGLMERHSWITGALAEALLGWAVGRINL